MAGEHSVVYVETKPGRFELRNVTLGPILKKTVVILDGLKPGEEVATSGNFLIDSQMQLAGKPSLIDPTRAIQKTRYAPLGFEKIHVTQLDGDAGEWIEQLFQSYFEIQRALAKDEVPTETPVKAIEKLTGQLLASSQLTDEAQSQLESIQADIPHLHHLALEQARVQFKSISHAVVTLATLVRGAKATQPFYHFFCPMVDQGAGDWLQSAYRIHNPYFGKEMPGCGELVRTIAPDEKMKMPPRTTSTNING